jgi:signal transduction histidine kinase
MRLEGGAQPALSYGDVQRSLAEALEQQTAAADILRVISSSPTDVQPVLDAIARNAALVCDAYDAVVFLLEGDRVRYAAHHGPINITLQHTTLSRGSVIETAILDRQPVHVHDLLATEPPAFPLTAKAAREGGYRTVLSVPLLRENEAIGALAIRRREAQPFTAQQIALLQTFADQAVIAIENARLFKELDARNHDLTEALEQQTATSEILRVISSSPTDVEPVFDTIIRSAVQLCDGLTGTAVRFDGEMMHLAAGYNYTPEVRQALEEASPMRPDRRMMAGRAILSRTVIQVEDALEDPEYAQDVARAGGFRSMLAVPMMREGNPIGAIVVNRGQPGSFSVSQIDLLKTFADQAVIAIENVRLFKELEARTAQLTRSVGELTALSEVSQALSSTLDLETVLTTIVSRAVQLSGLDGGVVFEYDEATEEFVHRAATETGETLAAARRTTRVRKGEGVVGRTALTLEPAQVPDITVTGAYDSRLRGNLIESGVRAILAVPMVREGQLIGCLVVSRSHPGDFPAETIELLRTFATQSALAIQNARLFHEIADKSAQLESASRHKSEFLANMSHELRTPLNAVIGFSEVLLQRMFGDLNAKQDEYLKDIYASGQHLLSLINDILDLSKIEAGRMELIPAPFHLPSALENAVTLVKERASRHGIALEVDIDPRLGELVGDERKVKQVLLNLLSNAVKFTPEGGCISLKASRKDGLVEIAVTDTGIGIAPEDQAAIFEEFRQVGSDETRKQEGTGLGLTLAKKFVELHGGRIWVESEPGCGSTFTFTLPVS